jgi:hypothetical protein
MGGGIKSQAIRLTHGGGCYAFFKIEKGVVCLFGQPLVMLIYMLNKSAALLKNVHMVEEIL